MRQSETLLNFIPDYQKDFENNFENFKKEYEENIINSAGRQITTVSGEVKYIITASELSVANEQLKKTNFRKEFNKKWIKENLDKKLMKLFTDLDKSCEKMF